MREAALFFLDYLTAHPETDELLFGPSLSPENQYYDAQGLRSGLCMAPTSDTQIVDGLFRRVVEAERVLGIQDGIGEELDAARARLPQPKIGRFGQLQEWREDYEEWEPATGILLASLRGCIPTTASACASARSSHGRQAPRSNGASLAAAAVRDGGARGSC